MGKHEDSLKKATEEAMEKKKEYEKIIKQEGLKKKTPEDIVTIKDSVEKSKTCWNCLDEECRSNQTNNKTKKKKIKNKNEAIIEKALTNEAGLSMTEKASLLESMSKYNEKNKNTQGTSQQIPPKSIQHHTTPYNAIQHHTTPYNTIQHH